MQFNTGRAASLRLILLSLTLHTAHFTPHTSAQRPPAQPNAAEILHRMQKLNVLGSVLYIVAHPDDENTRLITWLANGKKVRTGNLSLTRGDGGQNLIGPELGDALGIIRTQELMEARRIDGGEQFFTRAVDFGFSKNAKESFEKWGHDEVLSDVVRVIRMFRPDIIITRFAPDRSAGHGHHEASAILAEEAFDLAGDPKAFPEQLTQGLEVWQPRRLFFNGSTWWKKNLAEIAHPDSGWYTVDVGGYDPLLGLSYTEIAGRSRSMHKSQGFGAAETRGEMLEYLKLVKGDRPKTKDIFEGIDMTWGRVKGYESKHKEIQEMIRAFQPQHPERSIPQLAILQLQQRELAREKQDLDWIITKQKEIGFLKSSCAGWSAQVTATTPTVTSSDSAMASMTVLARSASGSQFISIGPPRVLHNKPNQTVFKVLDRNQPVTVPLLLDETPDIDQPFWLKEPHGTLYSIADPRRIGAATWPSYLIYEACLMSEQNDDIGIEAPTYYKWVDRVAGERIRPVYVTPVASVIPQTNVLMAQVTPLAIEVDVEALTDDLEGTLEVMVPEGWSTAQTSKPMPSLKRGEKHHFTFAVNFANEPKAGVAKIILHSNKGEADRTLHEIDYPHIMPQVYYTPAEVKLVPLDVQTTAKTVGYIKGAGDEVPQAIEQLGVKVDMVDASAGSAGQLTLESLKKYDAIVTGIRAYNTTKELKDLNPVLMKYVEEGGTLVVQYNTRSSDMVLPDSLFGPYPFKLTRDRVTVEEAPPTFLAKDHPLLNTPNTITAADFDGWVQERGLYFCGSLDAHYTPLIAWNDPGEQPLNGGLITCDYGKGRYVYTGISFFRELPAGVPGAYRLFANLISKRVQ